MSLRPSLDATVASSLVLRRYALAAFGGARPGDALRRAAHACAPPSWALFLRVEGCAVPLLRRLVPTGELAALPADVQTMLRRAAALETQRTLAALAQLATIDAVAHGLGVTAVAIKGAAHLAAGGEPIDLGDIDLVVEPRHAERLWDALCERGYVPTCDGAGDDEGGNHMPALTGPGGVPVEIHRRVVYGADAYDPASEARALPGLAAVRGAAGAGGVASLLAHAIASHPHRYGRLRDVVLVAAADRALAPGARAALDRALAERPDGREAVAMLAQARAVDAGVPIDDPAACRRIAARTYALVSGEQRWLQRVAPAMGLFAYIGFEGAPTRARRVRDYVGGRQAGTSRWYPRWLGARLPRLARLAAVVARTAPRVAIVVAAVLATPRALGGARRRLRIADVLVGGRAAGR